VHFAEVGDVGYILEVCDQCITPGPAIPTRKTSLTGHYRIEAVGSHDEWSAEEGVAVF
jgi:hypothetical protein